MEIQLFLAELMRYIENIPKKDVQNYRKWLYDELFEDLRDINETVPQEGHLEVLKRKYIPLAIFDGMSLYAQRITVAYAQEEYSKGTPDVLLDGPTQQILEVLYEHIFDFRKD